MDALPDGEEAIDIRVMEPEDGVECRVVNLIVLVSSALFGSQWVENIQLPCGRRCLQDRESDRVETPGCRNCQERLGSSPNYRNAQIW